MLGVAGPQVQIGQQGLFGSLQEEQGIVEQRQELVGSIDLWLVQETAASIEPEQEPGVSWRPESKPESEPPALLQSMEAETAE